ncbi:hypothetical protein [Pontimicrobium aquaticum]|uniref:Haem-binding uptake Tiki superfamily ChaN domain-containing protein n=1 Tax=Pontimicrobium aquaticum TaxID=2565367 RepID=A0A4U0F099_9FLAO|nr:hypothetical protein [Pontimicrobium aquaticum]TJY37776.1 hypothetical protein E5167_00550 [Pontimicrobium aquaticum]
MKKILMTLGFILISKFSFSQNEGSIARIVKAYDSTSIVAFGERHDQIELIEYYKNLVNDKSFQEKVDDIVLELGNSFYQEVLDRYVSGQNIPFKEVRNVWFSATNSLLQIGNLSAIEILIKHIREVNLNLPKEKQFRVIAADPPVNWNVIKSPSDFYPFLGRRDLHFATIIWNEVIDKKRNAFVIMGRSHLLRNDPKPVNYVNLVDILEARLGKRIFIIRVELDKTIEKTPVIKDIENTNLKEKLIRKNFNQKFKESIDAVIYFKKLNSLLIEPFSDKKDIEELDRRSLIINKSNFQFNSYDYLSYLIKKHGEEGVGIFEQLVKTNNSLISYNEQLVKIFANEIDDMTIKNKILEMVKELKNSKN